jgi:integrase
MNIEQRRGLWYAVVMIPKDVQAEFGKMKFIESLQTPSKQLAQARALPLISKWKAAIRQARGETDAVIQEAMGWKRDIANEVDDDSKETLQLVLSDRTEAIEAAHGTDKASQFYMVATGLATLLRPLYEEWKAQIGLAPKTTDQMCRDVDKLVTHFVSLEKISPKAVKAWVDLLATQEHTHSSLERILKACRNLWKYLKQTSVIELDAVDPFHGIMGLMSAKVSKNRQERAAFSPEDIATIYQAAIANGDQPLADMIALGAYTGARINELANVSVGDVTDQDSIMIRDSKTRAGIREIPIHPAIKELVARLVKDARREGFIVPTTAENQYGNRGDVIGKRFGRLKKSMGYTQGSEVFHSIRKTLITLMENAGVPEGIAADIAGHKKQTMTYGLYSAGTVLENKREALAKAVYPAPMVDLA